MYVAFGFANHLGHPQLLEVEGNQGGIAHVLPHGHDGAVIVAHTQGPEDRRVPRVPGNGVGDPVGHPLDQLIGLVHRQNLMAQVGQLGGDGGAEAPQADNDKCFHN